MVKTKNIQFIFPKKAELIGLMVMLFSFFGLYQASALYLSVGLDWTTNFTSDIPLDGALMFWLLFALFHFSLMFVMSRSVLSSSKRSTWNGYDFAVGFVMIIGLYFVAISTICGVFEGMALIEFMWNVPYVTLLNIGFTIEMLGILWFGFTD